MSIVEKLTEQILQLIENPKDKTILEVGSHDDSEPVDLANYFKKVLAYYEYVKIPERSEGNIEIKKIPFTQILQDLSKYDVLLMENEFHHFPDVWQMQTYDRLQPQQELLLIEWNGMGTVNELYRSFQNCKPLCDLTQQILNDFVSKGFVRIEKTVEGRYEEHYDSLEELTNYFKFMLPDHWKYGEKEFMGKVSKFVFPVDLWEGYRIYKIRRI